MNDKMKTEKTETTDDAAVSGDLQAVAARIWDWQQARGWTTTRMIREFPDLGSDKTYGSIRAGRLDDLDTDAWHTRYLAVLCLVEDRTETDDAGDVYDDLSAPRAVRRAMVDLFSSGGNARVLVLLGPSGIGKTTALRTVAERYGRRVAWVEACDVWRDNAGALLGAVIAALGTVPPVGATARLEACVALLQATRRCVVVDEAHHLGPHCLGAVKALVNQTPGEIVLSAIPTLWKRLETSAYEEARQVTTNRLAERIVLELTEADCARYFVRAVPGATDKTAKQAARIIVPMAARLGNFAFVRDVCRSARRLAADGAEVTPQIVADAAGEAARRR